MFACCTRRFFWCGSLSLLLLGCLLGEGLYAQDSLLSKSDMVALDLSRLAVKKKAVAAKDASLMPAYAQLLSDADRLLSYKPVSVMDKTGVPPSGSKHDYMSIAPYFWPDASKPDGLPYINKDGQVNPEVRQYQDKQHFPKLCENVYLLSLAYYFSDDEKYARHAARLLEVWFLDTATRMNPNLNFGQAVKGVTPGRSFGLIDSRFIIWAIDAIRLLQHSSAWTAPDRAGMKTWLADFLDWLQTSKLAVEEMHAANNHGVWYDAQCLAIATFLDSTALADKIVARAAGRLDQEMDPSGFFPLELKRTTSLHYSVFILNAFYVVAQLSEYTQLDLWTYHAADGKSLQKASEAIWPYIMKRQQWTGQEIHPFNFLDAVPVLLRSETRYGCAACAAGIRAIEGDGGQRGLWRLL